MSAIGASATTAAASDAIRRNGTDTTTRRSSVLAPVGGCAIRARSATFASLRSRSRHPRGKRGAEEQRRQGDDSERLERDGDEQVAGRAGGRDEPVDDPERTGGAGELDRAQPASTVTSPSLLSAWILARGRRIRRRCRRRPPPRRGNPRRCCTRPAERAHGCRRSPFERVRRVVGHVATTSTSPPLALASSTEPQNASTVMLPSRLETRAGPRHRVQPDVAVLGHDGQRCLLRDGDW